MKRKLSIALTVAALAALSLVVGSRTGESQAGNLSVAIYAPSVPFGTSAQRLQYLQRLGSSIEASTGRKVRTQVFTSLGALASSKPDFAIVEGQCVAAKGYKPLANAVISGRTARNWSLYSNAGSSLQALRGKKLAYMKTGCRDSAFLENAMFESEVPLSYFGGRVGKSDLNGAVAEVATLRGAQAVFAPAGSSKGLRRVFSAGAVPNPAFVQLNRSVSGQVVGQVTKAVVGYGGGGAISSWKPANARAYSGLRSRMGERRKRGVFAAPRPVRVDSSDVLIFPDTLDDTALTEVKQHFEQPPERLQ